MAPPRAAPVNSHACICCRTTKPYAAPWYGYARCSSCGLLRNEPFPTPDEIILHYQHRSAIGNYNLKSMETFDRFRKAVYRRAIEQLLKSCPAGLKNKNVLDVGCFTGLSLEVIQENGAIAYGIELQAEAARLAEAKSPGRVRSADICAPLPFPEKFAAVTMTDVVEHLRDPLAALESLGQSMENGGLLLVTTPNTGSVVAHVLGRYWPSRCPIHHLYLFNPSNLGLLLEQAGFEIVRSAPLWKTYSLEYVVWLLPSLSPALGRVARFIPKFMQKLVLPFNGGEMLIVARKRS